MGGVRVDRVAAVRHRSEKGQALVLKSVENRARPPPVLTSSAPVSASPAEALGSEAGLGLVLRAAAFAAWKHRDQRRKDADASPYINHPIALAEVLWTEGRARDPVVITGALLRRFDQQYRKRP
jgi:hypothetical protein